MDTTKNLSPDVVILGGGLAGLSLALQLKQQSPSIDICVLERRCFPMPEAAHKVGESTVELATHYFADVLGLKEHLDTAQLPKLGLRFFFSAAENQQIEKRLEVGARAFPPTASYQLDRGIFENFLADRCKAMGITLLDGAKVRTVELGETKHQVSLRWGSEELAIPCSWVVDATGRAAVLKRQLGLQQKSDHKANAAWFRVDSKIDVQSWSDDADWQAFSESSRWYSTNHLMGDGYWVWLIPLSSGATSIGIVADDQLHPLSSFNTLEKALAWLEEHEPQCAAKIAEAEAEVIDFIALKQYSHDCKQVFSSKRWCLTGEAGVFLDPFYSPGSDFIAMSNTFICDLIVRDISGEPFAAQATFFNDLYLSLYRNTATIFQDQYKLFGHPEVMPMKIVWDFATYWTFMAFLFFQGKLCDFSAFIGMRKDLDRIAALNAYMQRFFLQWHEQAPKDSNASGRVDLFSVGYLHDLNVGLTKDVEQGLSTEEVQQRLAENTEKLEQLAVEMVTRATKSHPELQSEELPGKAATPHAQLDRFCAGIRL